MGCWGSGFNKNPLASNMNPNPNYYYDLVPVMNLNAGQFCPSKGHFWIKRNVLNHLQKKKEKDYQLNNICFIIQTCLFCATFYSQRYLLSQYDNHCKIILLGMHAWNEL